jgi:hypothetical protein
MLKELFYNIKNIGIYKNEILGISVNWSPFPFSYFILFLSIIMFLIPNIYGIIFGLLFLFLSIGFIIFSYLLTKNFIKVCEIKGLSN